MLKIFKNKVGRPSNETIRKRRIIVSSLIAVVIIFVGLIVINKDKIFNLKGEAIQVASGSIDPSNAIYYSQADYQDLYCGRTGGGSTVSRTGRCTKGNSICTSGCGGTSIAIALSTITRDKNKYDPVKISEALAYISPDGNYCGKGMYGDLEIGTTPDGMKEVISHLGFDVRRMTTYSDDEYDEDYSKSKIINEMKKALKSGSQIVINANGYGCFTTYGHFMSIVSLSKDEKSVYLLDPNDGHRLPTVYGDTCDFERIRNGWWKISDLLNPRAITQSGDFTIYIISEKASKMTLTCPTSAKVNEKVLCRTNQSGVTISLGGANSLAKGISPKFVTISNDKTKSIKYTNALFTNYKSQIKKDKNGEYINARVTATKGSKSIKKYIKIYRPKTTTKTNTTQRPTQAPSKTTPAATKTKINLNCPLTAKVGEEFKCTSTESGVAIQVFGVKGLANGYDSKKTTWFLSKSIDIKFADKLFTNYKNKIKSDSEGLQYILVNVVAAKKGYSKNTKTLRIYQNKKTNNAAAKKTLSFTCPSTAKVGEKLVCTTNQSGVTIRTSHPANLAAGYTEKFVTTTSDYTKSLSYTKPGTYTVKASKSGYNSVTKKIKVTNTNASSNNKLVLTCPSSVYVNEPIICTTNMTGVTIRTSHPANLAAGYTEKFVTNATDLSKSLKYTKAGTYTVKASKSGYGEVKKTITVKNRVTQTTVDKAALYGIGYNLSMERGTLNQYNKKFSIKLTSVGSQVKYQSFVTCFYESECTRSDAWDYQKKNNGSGAVTYKKEAKVGKTESLTLKTSNKNLCGQVYYVRATTYDKNKKIKHVLVSRFSIDNNCSMTSNVVSSKFY